MTAGESPKDSIAVFAEVQASLSDPFGDRDVTLALRGLDERAWQSIEAAWTARLARNDDAAAELAQAYGEAFEAAEALYVAASSRPGRARLRRRRHGFAPASPFPATPAVVAPLAPTPTPGYTGTAAVDLAAIFKSAVPFDPSARGSVPASPAHAATKARPPRWRSRHPRTRPLPAKPLAPLRPSRNPRSPARPPMSTSAPSPARSSASAPPAPDPPRPPRTPPSPWINTPSSAPRSPSTPTPRPAPPSSPAPQRRRPPHRVARPLLRRPALAGRWRRLRPPLRPLDGRERPSPMRLYSSARRRHGR